MINTFFSLNEFMAKKNKSFWNVCVANNNKKKSAIQQNTIVLTLFSIY